MYQYPVAFPAISNRESWPQVIQIADDETGDLIALTDGNGTPLYQIFLEISSSQGCGGYYGGNYGSPYYDQSGEPRILASLSNYITIVDTGTIQIQIPYTVMQTLRGGKTYDVYLQLVDVVDNDARQLLIGKLPVAYGGLVNSQGPVIGALIIP